MAPVLAPHHPRGRKKDPSVISIPAKEHALLLELKKTELTKLNKKNIDLENHIFMYREEIGCLNRELYKKRTVSFLFGAAFGFIVSYLVIVLTNV